jgi:Ca2+-binding RTX toxin-like protein
MAIFALTHPLVETSSAGSVPTPRPASTPGAVTVTSAAGLTAALKTAVAGETIQLAAGNYGTITISNINIAGNVTITSENAGNPAVLTGLSVSNSSDLTFTNLHMSIASSSAYYPVMVKGSSNIAFSGLNVAGSETNSISSGMLIQNSADVSVTGSNFHQMANGIVESGNTGLTIAGNTFTGMLADGVDNSQSTNVNISNNVFTNFTPEAGAHPDAIQFWTSGTTKASSDITISGNTISAGSGGATQGIFLTDQVGNLPYQNVTISNNTITNEIYNGIVVQHANNVDVANNNVVSGSVYTSWIDLTNATNVSLTGNSASDYIIPASVSFSASDNLLSSVLQSDSMTSSTSIEMTYKAPLSHTLELIGTARVTAMANDLGDHIYANNAGDYLIGGAGKDILVGGTGNDTITAGSGVDTLTGGKGANTFVFGLNSTADTITDLNAGTHDVLNLSAYIKAGYTPTLTNSGANVIIGLEPGHSITLLGVHADGLIHTSTGFTI